MVFHKRCLWFWAQNHKQNHKRLWFLWGGIRDGMEAIPGKFHEEPPKAIWWRIIEDRKMDWHSDVQTKKREWKKRSQLQLDRRKQRPLEVTVSCDPWFSHSRLPLLSSASFCFFSVSSSLSAIRWLEGTDPKTHTHTHIHAKLDKMIQKTSEQPFWDKADSGDYSSLKIGHLDDE